MVPDTPTLRQRVLQRLLTSPWTLGPATLGLSAMLGGWAVGTNPALNLFVGAAGLAAGVGAAATRWVLGGDRLIDDAAASLRRDAAARGEARFDVLDARLSRDGDARTNKALARLRVLARRIDPGLAAANAADADGTETLPPPDLLSTLNRLLDSAFDSLEKSLGLLAASHKLMTAPARADLKRRREALLDEVDLSIQHIAHTLDELQTLSLDREEPGQRLAELRHELDQSLLVARRVEERMADLDRDLDPPRERT